MKKKVIAYIVIVAIVFLFMFFRQRIYYVMQERDGFYIDIGHQPNDKMVDIAYDEDIFIISRSRAKSGGVSYHAFTRLSSDVKVELEINLDRLVDEARLLEIEEMYDILVLEDVYIFYRSSDNLEEDIFVVLKLSREGEVLHSYESIGVVNKELLLKGDEIMLLKLDHHLLSYVTIGKDLLYVKEESLYSVDVFGYHDAVVKDDYLFMLLEVDDQYGLYRYDLETKETEIGSVDPKIKQMVVGEQLYLLEYQGDYINTMYETDFDVNVIDEITVDPYTFYDLLIVDDEMLFYGAMTVGDQIHAVYGEYDGTVIHTTSLDVPYNNYFMMMVQMDDDVLAVMRTNYLMDYQIRKTIYTEDDILYIID